MLRLSIYFASFAAALSDQCTREQWKNLEAILTESSFLSSSGPFLEAVSSGAAVESIVYRYADEYDDAAIGGTECFDNCVNELYAGLWDAYKTGDCQESSSSDCSAFKADLAVKMDYCARHNTGGSCSFRQDEIISGAADAAYDSVKTVATSGTFPNKFKDAIELSLDNAGDLPCFPCYRDYYFAKFTDSLAEDGEEATADEGAFDECRALYRDVERDACSADQIAQIEMVQELLTVVLEGQVPYLALTRMLEAASEVFDVTEARDLSCFRCSEDFFLAIFNQDGERTDCAVDSTCEADAIAARDACLALSLATATTTTEGTGTTTASGASSVAITAAAALVAAMATL